MYLYLLFVVPILPVVQCSIVGMYLTQNVCSFTDFKKSLEAALAKGSIEVEVLKCVTLGPTEAGKTQLKSALIGNFDRSSESTYTDVYRSRGSHAALCPWEVHVGASDTREVVHVPSHYREEEDVYRIFIT